MVFVLRGKKKSIIDSLIQNMNNLSKILKIQHYSHINVLHRYVTTGSSPHPIEIGRLFCLWVKELPEVKQSVQSKTWIKSEDFWGQCSQTISKELEVHSTAVVTLKFVLWFSPDHHKGRTCPKHFYSWISQDILPLG